MSNFVAIDFETANHSRTSACAVGLVHVSDGEIIAEETLLIRPPQRQFNFTHIHGITWNDVKDEPTFAELWGTIGGFISRGDFLVAHNAPFDLGFLRAAIQSAGLSEVRNLVIDTHLLSIKAFPKQKSYSLQNLAIEQGLPRGRAHRARDDAELCMRLFLSAVDAMSFMGDLALSEVLTVGEKE